MTVRDCGVTVSIVDAVCSLRFIFIVSTVAEIKTAIEKLSPGERAELEAMLWPERADSADTPPNVHERLAEAAKGSFSPGDRADIEKILVSLK